MFKGSAVHKYIYSYSNKMITLGAIISMIAGIVIQLPDAHVALERGWPRVIVAVYTRIADQSLWFFVVAIVLWGFGQFFRWSGDPTIHEHIQFLLNKFQGQVFPNGSAKHHHRVTLFQYKKCWKGYWLSPSVRAKSKWWPWGEGGKPCAGWLIPVMRSGHTSTKMSTAFLAPDQADRAEGVAGMAWARNASVYVVDLPVVATATSVKIRKAYARQTCTPYALIEKYIDRGDPMARSFGATSIEVNNRQWGVLVLDSREPNTIDQDTFDRYSVTIAMIGRLLERWA